MSTRGQLQRPQIPGQAWIHIDNIKNRYGAVWAVQWQRPDGTFLYAAVKRVTIEGFVGSVFTGANGQQPRAYLLIDNAVVELIGGAHELARVRPCANSVDASKR